MNMTKAVVSVVILLAIFTLGVDMDKNNFAFERSQMLELQLKARGIENQQVLKVMQRTPRELFMPKNIRQHAYEDRPFTIGYGQTISQPYIVAFMTEAAKLSPDSKVLEIGTGSGYQAAILCQLSKEVYTIEIIKELKELAEKEFAELGYANIHSRIGDGHKGWPEVSPFDIIIVTAAAEEVPQSLIEQLKDGGRLIIPIGSLNQQLVRITRTKDGLRQERLLSVRFVPMVK